MSEDVHADAVAAYEAALERAELIRAEWDELGRPIIAQGGATGRAPVAHPILRAIYDAEALADRLRDRVRKAHRGPQPAAVLRGGVEKSSSARLRAVGGGSG